MRWTPEQAKAIELRDKNILVAAAAGSGKTAVLVERIKRLILEERCTIDKMLIVTFTNAAAAEMKEKIEKAIKTAINEAADIYGEASAAGNEVRAAEAKEDMVFLKKQLELLPNSSISTFHAFALDVIRRYFYIIDIEPNFKICDETRQSILKGRALDSLFENYYEENSPEFYDFLSKFGGDRNDSKVRDMIEKTYETIQSLPEPYEWLDSAVENLNCTEEEFADSPAVSYLIKNFADRLAVCLDNTFELLKEAEDEGFDAAAELVRQDYIKIKELAEVSADGGFDRIAEAVDGFKLPVASKKYFQSKNNNGADEISLADFKEKHDNIRQPVKELVKSAGNDIFSCTLKEHWEQVSATYPDGLFLKKLILDFSSLYSDEKKKKQMADFSDIEHYAYSILKDEEAAAFYRTRFEHIFIDEYQDSNVIQEALIGRICRENNLFMVGDVKQSIYKFRLAEPEIFQRKYALYEREHEEAMQKGEKSVSEKIDLNRNFRSKKPVIDFINRIFENTMPGYDEKAALYVGDPNGDRADCKPELFLVQKDWNEDENTDDELKLLMKAEKEAMAAAMIINKSLGKRFFDSKLGAERCIEKKDIVILMRGIKKYGDIYYKILAENNLPAYVDDNDGYFDTIEINTFMALLALIDNEKQDVPLLTVMRSEIMNFRINELSQIRIEHKEGSYHDAVVHYAEEGSRPELKLKCAALLENIDKWRDMNRILPLDELIWELMISTGFYLAMGAMPAGSQRQANLRALVDKALDYRSNREGSLYGFMNYIDAVKKRKVAMGQVKLVSEGEDTIRIMTIHKSKGLEFPMVLVSGFCRRLNYSVMGKNVAVHKDIGIGLPQVNCEESWFRTTLVQTAIKERFHTEEADEEKRILYVAFTRARDILAILGICDDVDEEIRRVSENIPKDSTYMTMTGKTICSMHDAVKIISDSELSDMSKGRKKAVSRTVELLNEPCRDVSAELAEKLEFAYPYEKDLHIKSKYSVSELASDMEFSEISLSEPKSFSSGSSFTAAQAGTIVHKVLEKTDFAKAIKTVGLINIAEPCEKGVNTEYFDNLIEEMVRDEFISEEEAQVVDTVKLANFVLSPLGRRMAQSAAVYKEKPFNMRMYIDGTSTMVQGIIDCYFVEDGMLVLVDYKTVNITSKEEFMRRRQQIAERYRPQMEIYRKALEASVGVKVKEALLYLTNIGEVIKC